MIETLAKLTKSIYFQCIFTGFVKTPEKNRKPCIKLFTPSKIKVLFNTGKQIKSRTVKDAELKRVIKAVSSGQPKRSIAKFVYNSLLKDELILSVIHDIKKIL